MLSILTSKGKHFTNNTESTQEMTWLAFWLDSLFIRYLSVTVPFFNSHCTVQCLLFKHHYGKNGTALPVQGRGGVGFSYVISLRLAWKTVFVVVLSTLSNMLKIYNAINVASVWLLIMQHHLNHFKPFKLAKREVAVCECPVTHTPRAEKRVLNPLLWKPEITHSRWTFTL